MKFQKIAALVPMRHHSQRVPGKNYKMLAGKPLFHHILATLSECGEINEIVVNTDSDVIAAGIEKNFPQVIVLMRPEDLRADAVPMNDILMYDTSQVKADLYLQTHSTKPLLKKETISSAIRKFIKKSDQYDSLFSVTRLQTRLWDKETIAINHDPDILMQTQDLPPVYEENSCIYLFTGENLHKRNNRIGRKPLMYEISRDEAVDIDEEIDFIIADLLMKNRQNGQPV